jgi:hypothetical protein
VRRPGETVLSPGSGDAPPSPSTDGRRDGVVGWSRNFPQAFSHIGLVNSALYLGHADGHDLPGPPPMGIRLGDPVDGVGE